MPSGSSGDRPHLISGLGLPLRALVAMARHPEERGPLLLVVSLLVIGTVFYALVEGFTVIDAFYFSSMSLATVGFGDLVPTTDAGKIFTVVYVLVRDRHPRVVLHGPGGEDPRAADRAEAATVDVSVTLVV